jgi:TonB-linked SusC/RagA family outer membrane protein
MRFTSGNIRLGALLAAALLAGAASTGRAQQGTIAGLVTDQLNNAPVAGARILLGNTNRTAIANTSGRYAFTGVPAGSYELRVVAVGFRALLKVVQVEAGGSATADFALARAVISLDEIVVNPVTGVQRAREAGNAVTNIDLPKALENQTVSSFADALSGRAAGVQVLQSGGTVGTGTRIRIRGQSSLSLSNEPVYYIDGVRVESGDNSLSVGTGGQAPSRVNDINPEDIANVEIVKGPSASTLYGTQAANGVVRITTKHGLAGRARWRVYSEGGMLNDENQYPTNYFSWGHLTPDTFPAARRIVQCTLVASQRTTGASGSCAIDSLTSYNVLMDQTQTPIGTGYRGQGGLQVQGGSDQVQYYVSGDYQDELGVYRLPGVEYSRLTAASGGIAPDYEVYRPNELRATSLRSNVHVQPMAALDFTGNLGILQSRGRLPQNDNNVTGFLPSGLFGRGQAGSAGIWGFFLPGDVFQILVQQDITRITGSFAGNWRPTTWFTARGNVGVDYTGRTDINFQLRGQGTNFSNFRQGRRSDNRFNISHYTGDIGGTAAFTLAPELNSKTSVGFQYLKDNFFGVLATGTILPPGGKAITGAAQRTATEATTVAVTLGTYLEQTFGWRDRVFLTGGVRNDRNSAFGSKERSVVYPKVQGSWVLSDEAFYPRSLPISNLKLRFAYGASGQQPGTTDAILFYAAQTATLLSATGTATDQPGIDLTAFGNTSLKPERSTEFETGFDAGLFHDAARLEVTYYNKRTRDALINRTLPPSNGIAQNRFENVGSVQNRGFEAQLSVTKNVGPSVGLDAALSFARNSNKLLSLGTGIPPIVNGNVREVPGFPLFGFWDRPITGFKDADGNGIITASEVTVGPTPVFLGSSIPKTTVTLNAGITLFRNKVRLGGQLDYRGDWKAYNLTERFRCVSIGFNCKDVNVPGSDLDKQARAVAASSSAFGFTQAGYIEDAAFLKLREASLTYYAPDAWARVLRATTMQISVTGRNLLKWTSYSGIDPELNGNGQSDFQDDFLTAPPIRTLAVRVTLGF